MIAARPTPALAAAGGALLLAACGGGTKPKAGAPRHTSGLLAAAECMRAHGVRNFPDPTAASGGDGLSITATPGSSTVTIAGIVFSGPTFSSADAACKLLGGGGAPRQLTEAQKQRLVAFAQCMRKHGVTDFADPTFPSGGGVKAGGAAKARSATVDLRAPAAVRAVQTCNRLVPRT